MKSRERIKKAINHIEPDRVPIDMGGISHGIHEEAYNKLLKYLDMEDEIKIYDPIQRLAIISDEVMEHLKVDTHYVFPSIPFPYISPFLDSDDQYVEYDKTDFVDGWGTISRRIGNYSDVIKPALEGMSFEEIKKYKFPDPADPLRFKDIRKEALKLHNKTDYALISYPWLILFCQAQHLRGAEDFMVDTMINPNIANYLLDKITDWYIEFADKWLGEVGDLIEYFWLGDDWGSQSGPYLNPDYYRKEIVPRVKKTISFCKTKTRAKAMYHSCGAVYWCMEDFIEIGVDILQPLQPNAEGNDTEKIKREFGNRISFGGGTNNQGVFHKDIHTLTIDTLKRIKDLAPGGGYIFSSGHNIQANMPPENIVRFFELAREYGKYPIDIDSIDKRIEEEKGYLK